MNWRNQGETRRNQLLERWYRPCRDGEHDPPSPPPREFGCLARVDVRVLSRGGRRRGWGVDRRSSRLCRSRGSAQGERLGPDRASSLRIADLREQQSGDRRRRRRAGDAARPGRRDRHPPDEQLPVGARAGAATRRRHRARRGVRARRGQRHRRIHRSHRAFGIRSARRRRRDRRHRRRHVRRSRGRPVEPAAVRELRIGGGDEEVRIHAGATCERRYVPANTCSSRQPPGEVVTWTGACAFEGPGVSFPTSSPNARHARLLSPLATRLATWHGRIGIA